MGDINVYIKFEILKVKVLIIFLGIVGFSLPREGRYFLTRLSTTGYSCAAKIEAAFVAARILAEPQGKPASLAITPTMARGLLFGSFSFGICGTISMPLCPGVTWTSSTPTRPLTSSSSVMAEMMASIGRGSPWSGMGIEPVGMAFPPRKGLAPFRNPERILSAAPMKLGTGLASVPSSEG